MFLLRFHTLSTQQGGYVRTTNLSSYYYYNNEKRHLFGCPDITKLLIAINFFPIFQ